MSEKGFFKIWRELFEKPIWLNSTSEQRSILMTLIYKANWLENTWEWKGKTYRCIPGEFISSYNKIAQAAGKGVTVQNVRTAIKRFEKLEFLSYQSSNNCEGLKVKILNWSRYQEPNRPSNRPTPENLTDPTIGSKTDTAKVLEKEKREPNRPLTDHHGGQLTPKKKIRIERDNKLSLSMDEREILKSYVKRKKLAKTNLRGYINKIIENGDYIDILKEEKQRLIRLEQQSKEVNIPPAEKIEKTSPEVDKAGLELMRETVKQIRKRG